MCIRCRNRLSYDVSQPHSPIEWIETFRARGWEWVIETSSGEPVAAAYKFAYVTNAASGYVHPTPTLSEVASAYRRLCYCLGYTMVERETLREDLTLLGLAVVE